MKMRAKEQQALVAGFQSIVAVTVSIYTDCCPHRCLTASYSTEVRGGTFSSGVDLDEAEIFFEDTNLRFLSFPSRHCTPTSESPTGMSPATPEKNNRRRHYCVLCAIG
jgi:hypothetical protein